MEKVASKNAVFAPKTQQVSRSQQKDPRFCMEESPLGSASAKTLQP